MKEILGQQQKHAQKKKQNGNKGGSTKRRRPATAAPSENVPPRSKHQIVKYQAAPSRREAIRYCPNHMVLGFPRHTEGTASMSIKPTRISPEKTHPQPSNDLMHRTLRGRNLTTTKLAARQHAPLRSRSHHHRFTEATVTRPARRMRMGACTKAGSTTTVWEGTTSTAKGGSRPDAAAGDPVAVRSGRAQRARKAPAKAHQSQEGPVESKLGP
jgi:hypothetical protein